LNRDIEQAVAVWEHALRVSPDNEEVLRRLMLTCHDNSRTTAALEYARKLVKINPWNYVYFGRLAHLLGQTGLIDEGILAAERALDLNPGAVSIHGWLSEAYSQTGDAENALLHREHYLRLSAAVGE
jgi:tetratricopeptide (TPR) repeat protein